MTKILDIITWVLVALNVVIAGSMAYVAHQMKK